MFSGHAIDFAVVVFIFLVCSVPPEPVTIRENSTVDTFIATVNTTERDITLTLMENPEEAFELRGPDLMAKKGLDFEVALILLLTNV